MSKTKVEHDCGLLNRRDARLWYRWWAGWFHQPRLEKEGRLYRCYLTLNAHISI